MAPFASVRNALRIATSVTLTTESFAIDKWRNGVAKNSTIAVQKIVDACLVLLTMF